MVDHLHFTGGGGTTQAGIPGAPPAPAGRVELHEVPEGLHRVSDVPVALPEESRKLLTTRPPDCTRVSADPVKRPLPSLNSVREVPLGPQRFAAVPAIRPLASR